jgi:hypothetical protein
LKGAKYARVQGRGLLEWEQQGHELSLELRILCVLSRRGAGKSLVQKWRRRRRRRRRRTSSSPLPSFQDNIKTPRLLIFMHGNADDVSSSESYCQWLADELKSNVLSFDYRIRVQLWRCLQRGGDARGR